MYGFCTEKPHQLRQMVFAISPSSPSLSLSLNSMCAGEMILMSMIGDE